MKKILLKAVFEKIKYGGFTVVYWDGETIQYGNSHSKFTIVFKKNPPFAASIDDPILTFGEYYMDDIVDFEGSLEEMIRIVELNHDILGIESLGKKVITSAIKEIASATDRLTQRHNIHHHYDLGNDFFSLWLDKTMSYSCGYFKTPEDTLDDAQIQKIDHILKKLNLKPGEKLLDIGCGWGWLILRAAKNYGVKALGITLSEEQYAEVKQRIAKYQLEDLVDVKLMNYLDLDPKQFRFDKVVSVGMFEHVGKENIPCYMEKVSDLLVDGGLSMLHTITGMQETSPNSWAQKYIFPGGYVPSLREILWSFPDCDFHVIHVESLRLHYAMTLDYWYNNFAGHLEEVQKKFDRRFIRMWTLYLTGCAASFRASGLDIHQILFSKGLNNNLPLTLEHIYK